MNSTAMNASLARRPDPDIVVNKIGLVTRDYNVTFDNDYRDFSHVMPEVLKMLDEAGCDLVLFSLYSLVPRPDFDPRAAFTGLRNIKLICVEKFRDNKRGRRPDKYIVYHKAESGWQPYRLRQLFSRVNRKADHEAVEKLVTEELPRRILGNCCLLICGETNGVKYDRQVKAVRDVYGLRAAIPPEATIILNPVHDRMTRFEMKLKGRFLSENNRWVLTIWNKGKLDERGRTRDGTGPAWTVFHNAALQAVRKITNSPEIESEIEIGIVDLNQPESNDILSSTPVNPD